MIQSARKVATCSAVVNVQEIPSVALCKIMAEPRKESAEAPPSPEPHPKQPELHPSDFKRVADLVAMKLREGSAINLTKDAQEPCAGEWLLLASSYAMSSILLLIFLRPLYWERDCCPSQVLVWCQL